ncbi:MAG: gas vesicle protein K [Chloroflexota bacterium]
MVLTLVELLRQLVERQAVHRLEAGGLTAEQIERMGRALMELDATMTELCAHFGLEREELDIDLGPLGRLLP